jgi:glycosyltransferase involved in cell wall biosynthesis
MAKGKDNLDISVLIPTYNRAEILCETLETMCQVERDGLAVEFVIINNNSTDLTEQVVKSFSNRLPIRYLLEPRPGKNCALNKALNKVHLGQIIVFADDDVSAHPDWLVEITNACSSWPQYDIFGGRIYLVWPEAKIPAWASLQSVWKTFYGFHDLGDSVCSYVSWKYPFGANFWVRRSVFDAGFTFDEKIGPQGENRINGSETSFLQLLSSRGYHMLYFPAAEVGHRVHAEMMSIKGIRKRVWGVGMGRVMRKGVWRKDILDRSKGLWLTLTFVLLLKHMVRYGRSRICLTPTKRMKLSLSPLSDISYLVASLKVCMIKDTNSKVDWC